MFSVPTFISYICVKIGAMNPMLIFLQLQYISSELKSVKSPFSHRFLPSQLVVRQAERIGTS